MLVVPVLHTLDISRSTVNHLEPVISIREELKNLYSTDPTTERGPRPRRQHGSKPAVRHAKKR